MCKCTPEIRTPFCGRGDCLPPTSREPTESLFAESVAIARLQAEHKRVAQVVNELWMLWKAYGDGAFEDAVRQARESIARDKNG